MQSESGGECLFRMPYSRLASFEEQICTYRNE